MKITRNVMNSKLYYLILGEDRKENETTKYSTISVRDSTTNLWGKKDGDKVGYGKGRPTYIYKEYWLILRMAGIKSVSWLWLLVENTLQDLWWMMITTILSTSWWYCRRRIFARSVIVRRSIIGIMTWEQKIMYC